MKKISAFVLASSMALASTAAFAGGMSDPIVDPAPDAPIPAAGPSSGISPIWIAAPIVGCVLLGCFDSSTTSTATSTATN